MHGARILAAAAAAAALLLAAGCGGDDGGERAGAVDTIGEVGAAAQIPTVTLVGVGGPDRAIADFGGKILVVNFVATWHADSKAIVGIMNEIQHKFRRNVTVVAVTFDDRGAEGARAFARETGAAFDLFLAGPSAEAAFGRPRRFPTTFVLTRDARVFAKLEGLKRYEYYHNTIIRMFQQKL